VLSVATRVGVLAMLCLLALWTEYLNLKIGYNNPRLVELSSGRTVRMFYEFSDAFFSFFGEPVEMAQRNAGMTWSIRLGGVPFTDPVAALTVFMRNGRMAPGFALGLILPLGLALLFGRVFCSWICPASLLFFTITRVRRLLGRFFYFPELQASPGLAWGVLAGGLLAAWLFGHGIWTLLLPYLGIGQTIFHGLAFGTLAVAVASVLVFALIDLCLGQQFTCRYLCPTGRLLGFIGSKARITIRRDASQCLDACNSCVDTCPLKVKPKLDETVNCSLCGECLVTCPTGCLSIGRPKS